MAPWRGCSEHELTTAIRRCVLHSRSQSTSQGVERLRGARVSVSVEQVEEALLGAPGVVLTDDGRWQRA